MLRRHSIQSTRVEVSSSIRFTGRFAAVMVMHGNHHSSVGTDRIVAVRNLLRYLRELMYGVGLGLSLSILLLEVDR